MPTPTPSPYDFVVHLDDSQFVALSVFLAIPVLFLVFGFVVSFARRRF